MVESQEAVAARVATAAAWAAADAVAGAVAAEVAAAAAKVVAAWAVRVACRAAAAEVMAARAGWVVVAELAVGVATWEGGRSRHAACRARRREESETAARAAAHRVLGWAAVPVALRATAVVQADWAEGWGQS